MDLYDLLQNHLGMFFLVMTRVSGIFIVSPFLGSKNIPVKIKASVIFMISLVLFPVLLNQGILHVPDTIIGYALALFTELFIGWVIGFVSYLTFASIHMAGTILDMQVGFGVVNIMDPTSGQSVPIIGSFKYNLALIVFLVSNSHHLLLNGLSESFRLVPILGAVLSTNLAEIIVDLVWGTFVVAMQLSLPVLVAIILTDVALGILARTMPQMNIFVVGIPAKILIGIFVLSVALPFYILFLDVAFNEMYGDIYVILRTMQ